MKTWSNDNTIYGLMSQYDDATEFLFLFLGACGSVLSSLESNPPRYFHQGKLSGNLLKLKEYNGNAWANHGYTNLLIFQVKFISDTLKSFFNTANPLMDFFSSEQLKMFRDVLTNFQIWKTQLIMLRKEEAQCDHLGDATEFNRKDWTDIVPMIDAEIKKRIEERDEKILQQIKPE